MKRHLKGFISYAWKDREIAEQLGQELESQGFDLWSDTEISAGAAWVDRIGDALRDAEVVLFLVSPAAVASSAVMAEIGAAVFAGKPVIPIIPPNGRIPADLPAPLRKWQFVRAGKRGMAEVAAEIRQRLEQLDQPAAA